MVESLYFNNEINKMSLEEEESIDFESNHRRRGQ